MNTHLAALTFAIDKASASRVQLLPAGEFRATDGRPAAPTKAWRTDARVAAALSAKLAARSNDIVLDYEHQSLLSRTNGQPAPAAGWFKGLEWIEGKGLYAANVRWTDKAKSHIQADEYQYVSCVFTYDVESGEPQEIISAALTNTPALDGMDAVAALNVSVAALGQKPGPVPNSSTAFTTLGATMSAEALAAMTQARDLLQTQTAALSTERDNLKTQLAALSTELAALKTAQAQAAAAAEAEKKAALITAALTGAGAAQPLLAPAQKAWAEKLSLAALSEFLEASKPIQITGTQAEHGAAGTGQAALSLDEQKMAERMGVSAEAFAATRDGKPVPKAAATHI